MVLGKAVGSLWRTEARPASHLLGSHGNRPASLLLSLKNKGYKKCSSLREHEALGIPMDAHPAKCKTFCMQILGASDPPEAHTSG